MQNKTGRAPILIIGMHRSGTSMIVRILEELGLFMGQDKDVNDEAWFFLRLNDWLLQLSGGSWDHPDAIKYLLANAEVVKLTETYIHRLMHSPRVINYLGWMKYLRYRTPCNLDVPWGWKDPRTTYTLPIWLDLFPDAKVIHVYRNGVDVANSLMIRAKQHLKVSKQWIKKMGLGHRIRNKPFPIFHSIGFLTLDEGFRLWEKYMEKADLQLEMLPKDRTLSIRYEDFLEEPGPKIEILCEFCNIDLQMGEKDMVVSTVDSSRRKAYEQDKELLEFYESVKQSPQMLRYSY